MKRIALLLIVAALGGCAVYPAYGPRYYGGGPGPVYHGYYHGYWDR